MELCKLIASFFVIFAHVPFPGTLGNVMSCIARFPVPLFFAISGYFSYQINSAKLKKRTVHILLLNLAAVCIQIFWNFWSTLTYGGTLADCVQTIRINDVDLIKWLVLNLNPFGGHLWYLAASLGCYIMVWLYVQFFDDGKIDYRPMYLLSAGLLALHFTLDEFASGLEMAVPYQLTRNALLYGLPMFSLGLFLRQYREKIIEKYHLTTGKMCLILLAGIVFSISEMRSFGIVEIYLGTVVMVIMLMLLATSHPQICSGVVGKVVSRFGAWSTVIYIVHMALNEYYAGLHQYGLYLKLGETEAMLRPLIIAGGSLLIAICWDILVCTGKWLLKKIKPE